MVAGAGCQAGAAAQVLLKGSCCETGVQCSMWGQLCCAGAVARKLLKAVAVAPMQTPTAPCVSTVESLVGESRSLHGLNLVWSVLVPLFQLKHIITRILYIVNGILGKSKGSVAQIFNVPSPNIWHCRPFGARITRMVSFL